MKGNENEIAKLEHDDVYDVKKVSNFVGGTDGNLTRESIGGVDSNN